MDTPNTTQLHIKKVTKRQLKVLALAHGLTMTHMIERLVQEESARLHIDMEQFAGAGAAQDIRQEAVCA